MHPPKTSPVNMDNNPVNRINHKMQIIAVRKKAEKKYEITRSHSGHSS